MDVEAEGPASLDRDRQLVASLQVAQQRFIAIAAACLDGCSSSGALVDVRP
jgi:hypothetical protein